MQYYPLEQLINLYDGYSRQFRVGSHSLMLLQHQGRLRLLQSHCPHRGHSLEHSLISNDSIQCPLHAYVFSCDSGELLHASAEPCADLTVYALTYESSAVGVML